MFLFIINIDAHVLAVITPELREYVGRLYGRLSIENLEAFTILFVES
jgi:hypothetical protein